MSSATQQFANDVPTKVLSTQCGLQIHRDPIALRAGLTLIAVVFLIGLVGLPIVLVLQQALTHGFATFQQAWSDPQAISALRLTLLATASATIFNVAFGLIAALAVTKGYVRGRTLLLTIIDVPLSISPVIVGLLFVLLFGAEGWFGDLVQRHDIQVLFAWPAIVLATTFVTFPIVARELIPLLESIGLDQEHAARTLGANAWQVFWHVTLPNIRWGLLYGTSLCAARAMGEFGAVSVVSGHIAGETNTLPLHIEDLYNGYATPQAFSIASVFLTFAFFSVLAKAFLRSANRRMLKPVELEREP